MVGIVSVRDNFALVQYAFRWRFGAGISRLARIAFRWRSHFFIANKLKFSHIKNVGVSKSKMRGMVNTYLFSPLPFVNRPKYFCLVTTTTNFFSPS